MSSLGHANRGEKLGLVCRNKKKICQIINDFPLLTVLPLNYFMAINKPIHGRTGTKYPRSQFVLIDYMNGVSPIIQMKYMRGSKAIIHTASHR